MGLSFMECDTCRAKPGTPELCEGCRHNREVINTMNRELVIAYNLAAEFGYTQCEKGLNIQNMRIELRKLLE